MDLSRAERGPGPSSPVNARPHVGFSSPQPWRIEVPPGQDSLRWEIPFRGPLWLGLDDELSWVVHPESASVDEHRWDATYCTVDALLEDGSWLSELGVVDQYGQALTADAQGEGQRLWVDQWNLRRVNLGGVAGLHVTRVVLVVRASPLPLRVFVDDVCIRPARPLGPLPLDHVSTTRGTHSSDRFSRGNNAPLVGLPHGGVFGLPMTDASRGNWPYSYQADNRDPDNRPTIQAFATSHIPSPWMGDRGVFQVMPSPLALPDVSRTGRALAFDHAEEEDGPHRYAVTLEGGVHAELFPGDFALGLRFRMPSGHGSVIVDHLGQVRSWSCESAGDETVVRALLDDGPGKPPHHVHLRVRGVVAERLVWDGAHLGGFLTVQADQRGNVDVRLGLSTVSDAQAAANVAAAGDVDQMAEFARMAWERLLGTLTVDGATEDQRVSLYSGLYRLFLYPNRYSEDAGRVVAAYRSPYDPALRDGGPARIREGAMSSTHGFWDTYRTAWPLLALLDPEGSGRLADGFVEHARDRGWTPRWSAPGAEDCMTGTTFDIVLADLALRGIPHVDLATGYASALRNATVPPEDERVGRKGLRRGIFRGYIDTETHEGLSWTLDNAINDWGVAQLSRLLAARGSERQEDLAAEWEYFARRALSYRAVFDSDRGFFIGRTPTGEWRAGEEFDPDVWGHDYTETNAWGTRFTAPHDGAGLVGLYGGEAALGAALDAFFARPETGDASLSGHYGFAIHEMTEARDVRMGMLGLSNQPAHHIPFMYCFAGRHDDAHRVVRESLSRLFVGSDFGQGYPGDEDNGEMSAWYVLASVGLYPLVPGSASYVLVPPLVRRTELAPVAGHRVVLEAVGEGQYLASVTVDGEPWDEITLPHDVLARGAHVVFELAKEPRGWARDSRPPSASGISGFHTGLADAPVRRPKDRQTRALVDDLGDHTVELPAGRTVSLSLVEVADLSLYTVTTAVPGTYGWTVEYLDAHGAVVAAEERPAEVFVWERQTRPFRVAFGAGAHASGIRFTAMTDCVLSQLELFPADPTRDRRARE